MPLNTQLIRDERNIRPIGGWSFEVLGGIYNILEVEGIEKPGSLYEHTFSQNFKVVDDDEKVLLRIKKGDVYRQWLS